MESNLSRLSSLKDDDGPPYIQPHYRESYRLAIYALLCGGKEAYEEFLRAEQVSHLLSEEEILFVLENAELPVLEDEADGKRPKDAVVGASTYFPTESDEEVPDLELGWPEVSLEGVDTSISLLFHPPRQNTPSIKEVVRKQVQEARQVIAIAMDVFTDFDIFREVIGATLRGVSVYILLDEAHFSSFLTMCHKVGVNVQDLKNLRVRTVQGQQYRCQSGVKFYGGLEQKFILIDCQTVLYGTYSYTWSFEKINVSMVLVITGQLVCSYDEEFRRLYARSTVPAVPSRERLLAQYPRNHGAPQSPNSSQLSLHQIPLRGIHGMRGAQDDRFSHAAPLYRGISMQDRLHQGHCPDMGNMVRGHSYGGELHKLNSLIRLRMGNKDPERTGSNPRAVGDFLLPNRLSQQHLRHRTRYGPDQNLIPFNSESSLHKWKMDTYLNDSDAPLDASCDALSPMMSPYSSTTGLNEQQSQVIHNMSRDIKSRMDEMRQKRLSLQEYSNFRRSQEFLRNPKERPTFLSSRGLDLSGAELEPNGPNGGLLDQDSELPMEGTLTDGQRSASYYDVKMYSERKTKQAYDWHAPLPRTTSAGELDLKSSDLSLKLSHLQPGGLNVQGPRAMESLREIPEEKEGSNTRVNTSDSALFKEGCEETRKEKRVPMENSRGRPDSRGSRGSKENVLKSSSSAPGEVLAVRKISVGSQHAAEAKRSHAEKTQVQGQEPTLQRKNSLRMKVYSFLTADEKRASKKEEKYLLKKGSTRTKNPSGSNQPVRPARSQASLADQPACKPPNEAEKQRSSKRKTSLSAEQDRGSGSTLDGGGGGTVYQRQKVYSRYEYLMSAENASRDTGASLSRMESGLPACPTQSGTDNKLGRFMQRVGSLIGKNK